MTVSKSALACLLAVAVGAVAVPALGRELLGTEGRPQRALLEQLRQRPPFVLGFVCGL